MSANNSTINKEKEAGAGNEAIKNTRNFKNSPDVENFYRFVQENGLRREAKMIFDTVLKHFDKVRKKKNSKH